MWAEPQEAQTQHVRTRTQQLVLLLAACSSVALRAVVIACVPVPLHRPGIVCTQTAARLAATHERLTQGIVSRLRLCSAAQGRPGGGARDAGEGDERQQGAAEEPGGHAPARAVQRHRCARAV